MRANDESSNPESFFSVDYLKKRGSWSGSAPQPTSPPIQKKRGSAPTVPSAIIEEVEGNYSLQEQGPAQLPWTPLAPPPALPLDSEDDFIERLFIAETLKVTGGNREQASEMLGIGERTLYRKIKEFQLS